MLSRKNCFECCSKKSQASFISHGLERSLAAHPVAEHARRFLKSGRKRLRAEKRREQELSQESQRDWWHRDQRGLRESPALAVAPVVGFSGLAIAPRTQRLETQASRTRCERGGSR